MTEVWEKVSKAPPSFQLNFLEILQKSLSNVIQLRVSSTLAKLWLKLQKWVMCVNFFRVAVNLFQENLTRGGNMIQFVQGIEEAGHHGGNPRTWRNHTQTQRVTQAQDGAVSQQHFTLHFCITAQALYHSIYNLQA